MRSQDQAEREQADVMLLARGARQQRNRTAPAAPQASDGEETGSDQVAREVLLADPERPLLPLAPDLGERRKDELAKDGLKAERPPKLSSSTACTTASS